MLAAIDDFAEPQSAAEIQPTVYVIDDDVQVLEIIQLQLQDAGFRVRTFSGSEPFLQQLPTLAPGIVICDQRMPFAKGLDVQTRIHEQSPLFQLILISAFPETRVSVEAMRHGAVTVLDKPYEKSELLSAVEEAIRRSDRLRRDQNGLPPPLPAGESYLDRLSSREREVLDLVYEGATNKSVAIRLGISIKTVEKHRGKAMKKMEVNSLAELVRLIDRELKR